MKMMRLLSSRARQNITYMCRNSMAWADSDNVINHNTIKVLTDNEVELHGHALDTGVFLNVVLDECKVCMSIQIPSFCHDDHCQTYHSNYR